MSAWECVSKDMGLLISLVGESAWEANGVFIYVGGSVEPLSVWFVAVKVVWEAVWVC